MELPSRQYFVLGTWGAERLASPLCTGDSARIDLMLHLQLELQILWGRMRQAWFLAQSSALLPPVPFYGGAAESTTLASVQIAIDFRGFSCGVWYTQGQHAKLSWCDHLPWLICLLRVSNLGT